MNGMMHWETPVKEHLFNQMPKVFIIQRIQRNLLLLPKNTLKFHSILHILMSIGYI